MTKTPERAWAEARSSINLTWLAETLEPPLTRAGVSAWKKVPAERVLEVSRLTGVPRERLRPDLYDPMTADPWSQL